MTEAELRRLAELLHDLSANERAGFWQQLGQYLGHLLAFALGIAATLIERWIVSNQNRRQILQTNRVRLLESLEAYRDSYQRGYQKQVGGFLADINTEEMLDEHEATRQRVRDDLVSVDDRKYTRMIAPVLLWNTGVEGEERLERLNAVTKRLREENETLLEQMETIAQIEDLWIPPEKRWKGPLWFRKLVYRLRRLW